ncbi:putative membrane protein [Burkholderia plantarii]|uniref:Putative membrane protein n=2 Tax=Burkholderia plantarii TaxID=41899 RepID=A0A0B6S7Z2_BURPL|nr:putative membrane protein [Burkholderia plantarii]
MKTFGQDGAARGRAVEDGAMEPAAGSREAGAAHDARRRSWLRAAAGAVACGLGGVVAAGGARAAEAARGGTARVTLLAQLGGPDLAVDQRIAAHLGERGYAVRLVDQAVPVSVAADADLVMISSTVSAKAVLAGWRHLATPLVTWENDLLDDLAMTGKRHDVDFGETGQERHLWLVNAPHPIAAGLPAGTTDVYGKQAPMSWGKPGLGASIIATVYGQPEKAAIFAYERGATMDCEALAPARRVMLFLDNDTFPNLSTAGVALFDAAVDWAAGRR